MKNFLTVLIVAAVAGFLTGVLFFNLPEIANLQTISAQSQDLKISIENQNPGVVFLNPIKYIIRGVITGGVSAQTVALLLLLTVVTAFIAGVRHLVGVKSFGIFMPTALAVVFFSIGPILGIGLFLVIISVANLVRAALRKFKIHLQYLPRMAFILLAVVVSVLFILFWGPILGGIDFSNISVLPLFILILLAEDFIRTQVGKSVKTAISLTTETLILSFASYLILTFIPLQKFALLNPEILLIAVAIFDFTLGKYIGLRFLEYRRFRKLIKS